MTRTIPQSRKTPIEHKVHAHIRKKRPVKQYLRGKGKRKEELVKPRSKSAKAAGSNLGFSGSYVVTIDYDDRSPERFFIDTKNPEQALNTSLSSSRSPNVPREVKLVRR